MSRSVPEGIRESLILYVDHRIHPGGFLSAVLSNDLRESFARADEENRFRMFDIVSYVYNEIPASCWGSPEAVTAWLSADEVSR